MRLSINSTAMYLYNAHKSDWTHTHTQRQEMLRVKPYDILILCIYKKESSERVPLKKPCMDGNHCLHAYNIKCLHTSTRIYINKIHMIMQCASQANWYVLCRSIAWLQFRLTAAFSIAILDTKCVSFFFYLTSSTCILLWYALTTIICKATTIIIEKWCDCFDLS